MLDPVDTRVPVAVENEVRAIHAALFPQGESAFVPRAFAWTRRCFTGDLPGYQPIDIGYHDFEHTLQGALCLARLLHGLHASAPAPVLTARDFELGLLAILFHDTGYLKRRGDNAGTGAKYTAVHVDRSAAFATDFLAREGLTAADLRAVRNMIHCTGVKSDLAAIPFQCEAERIVGFSLGTADLLGQMAARDYVEKLPALFEEFAEGVRYATGDIAQMLAFASAEELMRSTPDFWDGFVRPRIDGDFLGLYRYLSTPYPDGPNAYLLRIEDNVARLR